MPTKAKKKETWLRRRHRVVRNLAALVLGPYVRLKTGVHVTHFRAQGDRQYLIVANHQTGFDQFLVGMAFKGAVYYIASEDLFSNGFISKLLRWAVNPIPIKKQTTDVKAVMNCLRVAREGGTIALFPEGNRTYDGKPVHIKPGIVGLMRKLGLPLAIFRIEGGYGVQPRWADKCRKGPMRAYVSQVIEPEEYNAMTNEQLYALVCKALYVDECNGLGEYRSRHGAEYLERALYVCPDCGLSTLESHGDSIACKRCGRTARHLPNRTLEGVPFRNVSQWYDYQCDFVRGMETDPAVCLFRDKVSLWEVTLYKHKKCLRKSAEAGLWSDRITIDGDLVLPFSEISTATVLGHNKLNLYWDGKLYQLRGDKRFNALKYVNLCYLEKNRKGENDNDFLGI
ncbi:MAG: 1-acyl-sn-glycerol-3-phosphate acyltransferase [Oscillospiraceae bacterium]|nr:1-acyl-sn-glycerol-3-phosphate acyltransferase [Oscillospiraceae bacterium]